MAWLAAAADTTPQVPWWIAVVTGLGSGIAVGLVGFIAGWRQRLHDSRMRDQDYKRQREQQAADHQHERELRRDDHEHDLAVRREEDQRRRRDVRLQSLADGLASMVSAALDLKRLVDILPEIDEVAVEERRILTDTVNAAYMKARAGLLLDRDGWKVVGDLEKLQRGIRQYGIMVDHQRKRSSVSSKDVDERQERLDDRWKELRGDADILVANCRAIVERVAASVEAEAR